MFQSHIFIFLLFFSLSQATNHLQLIIIDIKIRQPFFNCHLTVCNCFLHHFNDQFFKKLSNYARFLLSIYVFNSLIVFFPLVSKLNIASNRDCAFHHVRVQFTFISIESFNFLVIHAAFSLQTFDYSSIYMSLKTSGLRKPSFFSCNCDLIL